MALDISTGISECDATREHSYLLQTPSFIQIANSSVIHGEFKKLEEGSDIKYIIPVLQYLPLLHLQSDQTHAIRLKAE